jgi:hypothetical protein
MPKVIGAKDITRLPIWAQDMINSQGREIRQLRDELTELHELIEGRSPDSDVYIDSMRPDRPNIPLPPRSQITFRLNKAGERTSEITVRIKDRSVYVMGTSYPGGLLIKPGGGVNVVEIMNERR